MQDSSATPGLAPERLEFTGRGGEYFRIWIVNVLLSVLTLGIYSAWAKVRRLRYFYQHTRLAGSGFDYHGQPLAILKGRLIALALLLLYSFAQQHLSALSALILVGIAAILPWLLRNSLRFRAWNSSWRGLRFSFRGTTGDAYLVFLVLGGLAIFTGFLWPLFHSRLKKYQHGHAWFGQTPASFHATDGQFYGVYVKASLMWLGMIVAVFALMAAGPEGGLQALFAGSDDPETARRKIALVTGALVLVFVLGGYAIVGPYLAARLANLTWNHTRLGEHRFHSTLSARRLTWLYLSNFVLVLLTLGLFTPWAMVRVARYRAECMTLLPAASLEQFVAAEGEAVAAAGEETAELFDIDIAL